MRRTVYSFGIIVAFAACQESPVSVMDYTEVNAELATAESVVNPDMIDLGLVGGHFSLARGISEAGLIMGLAYDGANGMFVGTADGGVAELNFGADVTSVNLAFSNRRTHQGISDAGHVTGTLYGALGAEPRQQAFVWSESGGMKELGILEPLPGNTGGSAAVAVNTAGQVAGASILDSRSSWHAFRWSAPDVMEDLGALTPQPGRLGRSWVTDMNNAGVIVGWSVGWRAGWGAEAERAVRWVPGMPIEDLGALGNPAERWPSFARAINDHGQITGSAFKGLGERKAFLWTETDGMLDLGGLGGNFSEGTLINERGHVAGTDGRFGFFWSPETGMIDLGTLPNAASVEPLAMNNLDHIVGWANVHPDGFPTYVNDQHAFLWTPEDGMIDLGALAEYPDAGRSRAQAYDINDRGEIVGHSAADDGLFHAFYVRYSSATPESATEELIDFVVDLDLSKGRETALLASLKNALKKIKEGDFETAAEVIGAFISKVAAQRGKSITEEDADALITMAQEVLDLMNAT